MTISDAQVAARQLLDQLPQPVHDALEHVVVRVVDDPPPQVPSDVKGIFVGHQQIGGPEDGDDDDDSDAGEHFDVGDAGDLELVAVGGGQLADGCIYLVAGNLCDAGDLEHTLYHEISHALGLDEAATEELGLG